MGSYCLMSNKVSFLQNETNSGDGWWKWLYNNINVLDTTEVDI